MIGLSIGFGEMGIGAYLPLTNRYAFVYFCSAVAWIALTFALCEQGWFLKRDRWGRQAVLYTLTLIAFTVLSQHLVSKASAEDAQQEVNVEEAATAAAASTTENGGMHLIASITDEKLRWDDRAQMLPPYDGTLLRSLPDLKLALGQRVVSGHAPCVRLHPALSHGPLADEDFIDSYDLEVSQDAALARRSLNARVRYEARLLTRPLLCASDLERLGRALLLEPFVLSRPGGSTPR